MGGGVLAAALWAAGAEAEVRGVEVAREGDRFHASAEGEVNAPSARVRALLTDFEHLERLHPAVVESAVVGPGVDGATRVRVRSRFCVLVLLCLEVQQVLDFDARDPAVLRAVVIPPGSELRDGTYAWRITGAPGGATRVSFDADVQPDFWVPPLIGAWLFERELRRFAAGVAGSLERLAPEAEAGAP